MKKLLFVTLFLASLTALNAQSRYKQAAKPAAGQTQTPAQTNKPEIPAAVPATTAPASAPAAAPATVNVRYDTTVVGGFESKPEVSLRSNYAIERDLIKDRTPLEYDFIREDDQFWSHFVWEEIDAHEKINMAFMYPGKDDNGDQRFFSILLNAIKYDSVVAFSPENDQFKIPMTADQIASLTAGSLDTVDVSDPVSGAIERVITRKPKFSPDSVYTFRIKEQWIFDKESSKLTCRIIGIAPIAKQVVAGKSQPRTLFWIYYPDLRKTLVKYEVYNPKNFAGRMSWEELFEGRYFSSYVIKSTINNPGDKYLNALIKDPMFRLLEGQNIKDKIFNYEQDLWSY